MKCPRCGLINPEGALQCDCGHLFAPAAPPPPAAGPPPPAAPLPPTYPTYGAPAPPGPPPGYQWPAAPQPASGAEVQLKTVGVFNIVAGALSLAWALLMVIEVIAVASGALDSEFSSSDDPPKALMIAVFAGMFFFSAIVGVVQIVGGGALLKRAPAARKLGYAAAIASLISLWNCCVWPLCAGAGIYTLIVLQKPEIAELLGEPPRY